MGKPLEQGWGSRALVGRDRMHGLRLGSQAAQGGAKGASVSS